MTTKIKKCNKIISIKQSKQTNVTKPRNIEKMTGKNNNKKK